MGDGGGVVGVRGGGGGGVLGIESLGKKKKKGLVVM